MGKEEEKRSFFANNNNLTLSLMGQTLFFSFLFQFKQKENKNDDKNVP
jgi:hypothetical protein